MSNEKTKQESPGLSIWLLTIILLLGGSFFIIHTKHQDEAKTPLKMAIIDVLPGSNEGNAVCKWRGGGDGKISISFYSGKRFAKNEEMKKARIMAKDVFGKLVELGVPGTDVSLYVRVYSPAGTNAAGEQLWLHRGVLDYTSGVMAWRNE